jgi:hydrogenase 3 maturation protease
MPIIKKNPDNLIIVDAMDFATPPGTLDVFEPQQLSSLAVSTHVLSLHLLLDIIHQSIKVDVYIIGIQPQQTGLGQPVSPLVKKAIDRLAELLISIFCSADK